MADTKPQTESEKPEDDKKTKPGKKSGSLLAKIPKKILIIGAAALIVIVGALVATHTLSAHSKTKVKKPVVHGPVLALDEFLVNLADPGGDHYLKVTVGLEIDPDSGKTPETLKDQVPIIRDAILTALTSKERAEVDSLTGRVELKNEIKDNVNQSLGQNVVTEVYFTDFVTQ